VQPVRKAQLERRVRKVWLARRAQLERKVRLAPRVQPVLRVHKVCKAWLA
jgi:hypothetical protein